MTVPFLFNYSVQRKDYIEKEGYYSESLQMWAINSNGSERPLIDEKVDVSELATKTDGVTPEQDDQSPMILVDTITKTMAHQESDDQVRSPYLLQCSTITETQNESTDVRSFEYNLFI